MKIQLQLACVFMLLGINMSAQSTELVEQTQSNDWLTLDNSAFEIKYPNDWESNNSGLAGTTFILFSELTDANDKFRDNVNLIMQDVAGYNLTLEGYIEISLTQLPSIVPGSKVLVNETLNTEDGPFQKLIYTGKQGEFDLKFEQYIWLVEEQVFVLTLTCEIDTFEQYQKVGEEIMESFIIKE